jgi:hypothetical protein
MGVVVARALNGSFADVSRHFSLSAGQVLRLKKTIREINIISGCAWVSYAGHDMVLNAGDRAAFAQNHEVPVISALGKSPLLFNASK